MGDEVKTKSSYETVKPSSPTPAHLRSFKLSLLDTIFPPLLTPTLLLYPAKEETAQPDHVHIATILKASLSETLCRFYPLAGRFADSSIDCNDEGIPFVENHVNFSLSTLVNSFPKLDLLTKLYPPRELLQNTGVNLAVQFNVFTCGGVAIGWYDMHKVLDGSSAATFLKHWAAVSRNRYKLGQDEDSSNIVHPNFDATLAAFPPSPKAEPAKMAPIPLKPAPGPGAPDTLVVKAFIFLDTAISELKIKAVSERVPNPSRFESVGSFIWKQLLQIAPPKPTDKPSDKEGLTAIVLNADMRSRAEPPLPRECMGNLTHILTTWADNQAQIPELVAVIREAILSSKDKIREFQGENRVEALNDNWKKVSHIVSNYKEITYKLVSWSKVGFEEIDFGFGKPTWVVPSDGRTNPSLRNKILLNDYAGPDGVGLEAWLFLEKDVMERLETNQDFLAFAYPKF